MMVERSSPPSGKSYAIVYCSGLAGDRRRMNTPNDLAFTLEDEHRARVRDCLVKDGLRPSEDDEHQLCADIAASIGAFLAERNAESTPRENHDALRALYVLAHEDDCPVGQLRARLGTLPKEALDYVSSRAVHLIPRLFPDETLAGGFLAWAATADREKLVEAVRVLGAEGGRLVAGRKRGPGKRSRPKLEPSIMGHVRGVGDSEAKSGRPGKAAQDKLVMHLALDWLRATGREPPRGRSDRTGFGDLVHSVFGWLGENGADQALRRYWAEVKRTRIRPVDNGLEYR